MNICSGNIMKVDDAYSLHQQQGSGKHRERWKCLYAISKAKFGVKSHPQDAGLLKNCKNICLALQ